MIIETSATRGADWYSWQNTFFGYIVIAAGNAESAVKSQFYNRGNQDLKIKCVDLPCVSIGSKIFIGHHINLLIDITNQGNNSRIKLTDFLHFP